MDPERREAREVARRGDVGHAVAPRRQELGELQEREQVAECQPRAEHDAQRPRRGGPRVHGEEAMDNLNGVSRFIVRQEQFLCSLSNVSD